MTPVTARPLAAFSLPLVLLAIGLPVASAQCSQAKAPEAATSDQAGAAAQSNAPVAAGGDSSSLSTPAAASEVRFATGRAVTVLENTPIEVITDVPISSRTSKAGEKLPFTVTRDVVVDGVLVVPCGARVYGTVVARKQAGRLGGASNLTLQWTELNLGGKTYSLYTPEFKVVGQSKTKSTVKKVAAGAAVGAVAMQTIGSVDLAELPKPSVPVTVSDSAKADGVAAGLGAGVGTAVAAISPPSIALIPAESQLEFTLSTPIAVFPVDQPTAKRLARGMFPGGPVLYVRGESQ